MYIICAGDSDEDDEWEIVNSDEEQDVNYCYKEEWLPLWDDIPQAQPMDFNDLAPPVMTQVVMKKKKEESTASKV